MSSPASREPLAGRPLLPGPRPAIEVGPHTYVMRPGDTKRLKTYHRWKRRSALLHIAGSGLACSSCGERHHIAQLQFAHYRGAPKRSSGGGSSILAARQRAYVSAEDLDELRYGRFLCANCHALETALQSLGDAWLDDLVFTTAEAERRWFAARNSGVPRGEANARPLVPPLREGT